MNVERYYRDATLLWIGEGDIAPDHRPPVDGTDSNVSLRLRGAIPHTASLPCSSATVSGLTSEDRSPGLSPL